MLQRCNHPPTHPVWTTTYPLPGIYPKPNSIKNTNLNKTNHATNAPSKPSAPPPGEGETPRRLPGKTDAGTPSPLLLSETPVGPTPRRGRATPSRARGNPPEKRSANSVPVHAEHRAHPRHDSVTWYYVQVFWNQYFQVWVRPEKRFAGIRNL